MKVICLKIEHACPFSGRVFGAIQENEVLAWTLLIGSSYRIAKRDWRKRHDKSF